MSQHSCSLIIRPPRPIAHHNGNETIDRSIIIRYDHSQSYEQTVIRRNTI